MKKSWKKILSIIGIIFGAAVLVFAGIIMNMFGFFEKGNRSQYSPRNVASLTDSPLEGMHIAFLGSSVTQGFSAKGTSFVEFICKRNHCTYVKEAVPGTTLVDTGENSYVQRMLQRISPDEEFDLFIVQLSTNDAGAGHPLGMISDSTTLTEFNTATIAGAIEYIISYAKNTWDCPVVFYTSPYYDNETYDEMVNLLHEIESKWDIGVIDLWNDAEMRTVDADARKLYMHDDVHPTRAGYLEWWTPKMESFLYTFVE